MVVICMVDGSSRCGVHRRPRYGTSMPGAGAVHPIKNYATPEIVLKNEGF
jgi:hypothetical protein